MKVLKSGQFWAGVIAALVLVAVFPQANPRMLMSGAGKPKVG